MRRSVIYFLKLVDEELAKSLEKLKSLTASARPFEKVSLIGSSWLV